MLIKQREHKDPRLVVLCSFPYIQSPQPQSRISRYALDLHALLFLHLCPFSDVPHRDARARP